MIFTVVSLETEEQTEVDISFTKITKLYYFKNLTTDFYS